MTTPEDRTPRESDPNQPRRTFPFSTPPAKHTTNWWKTIPGQLAIVVIGAALFLILIVATGVIHVEGVYP
jgi:hypothetical protein